MKIRALSAVVALSAFFALVLAAPASARNAAEDLIRDAMANNGVTSGYAVNSKSDFAVGDGGETYDGLVLDWAFAKPYEGPGYGMIVVVENHSDTPYCIRPKTSGLPGGETYQVQTVNQIVEPGGNLMIVGIAGRGYSEKFDATVVFAFWPPDYSQPKGSWCRANAPDGLQAWLDDSELGWFSGSRR